MRTSLLLLLSVLLIPLAAAPSLAQDAQQAPSPARGSLPSTQKTITLGQPAQAELKQAEAVGDICRNSNERDYFDCDCVTLNYLQGLMTSKAMQQQPDQYTLKDAAKKSCATTPPIAGRGYANCMTWAPKVRQDYEEFCTCYGNAYAKEFARNPATTIRGNEQVMAAALQSCNAGAPVMQRMNRNARLNEMKEQGIYEQMFPNARTEKPKSIVPQPAAPARGQRSTSQILTDQLFDTTTPRDRPAE